MRMVCEKYKCEMDVKACLARQKKYDSNVAFSVAGRDPGCRDCAQGKQIKQATKGKTMTDTAVDVSKMLKEGAEKIDQINGTGTAQDAAEPKTKWCPSCETWLPADLDHFYEDHRGRLNLSCWCKECQRARGRKSKKQKAQAERTSDNVEHTDPAAQADPVPETPVAPEAPERRVVVLDFTDHPAFMDRIEKAAAAAWRSPDQQIMAWAELGLIQDAEWTLEDDNKTPVCLWAQEETDD